MEGKFMEQDRRKDQILVITIKPALWYGNINNKAISYQRKVSSCDDADAWGLGTSSSSQVPGMTATGSNQVAVRMTPFPRIQPIQGLR